MANKDVSKVSFSQTFLGCADKAVSKDGTVSSSRPIAPGKPIMTAVNKTAVISTKMCPKDEPSEMPVEELLGSLTTYNGAGGGESAGLTLRTSARVIKKMRLDSTPGVAASSPSSGASATPVLSASDAVDKEFVSSEIDKPENDSGIAPSTTTNPSSFEEKDYPTGKTKSRMPKAPWSTHDKNLFFEALNEFGKDFDAITAYICSKMKRKTGSDAPAAKAKHQVSHFYYRTWQKISKYVNLSNNVKKVVQELYSLINYGEMRKRLITSTRIANRLAELVRRGMVACRIGGKTLRVRTPVCRALKKLNNLEEWDAQLRLPTKICIISVPRDQEAWARVQSAAQNPRMLAPTPPSCRLATILAILQRRWQSSVDDAKESLSTTHQSKNSLRNFNMLNQQINILLNPSLQTNLTLKIDKLPSLNSSTSNGPQDITKLTKIVSNGVEKNTETLQSKKELKGSNPVQKTDESINANKTLQKSICKNDIGQLTKDKELNIEDGGDLLLKNTSIKLDSVKTDEGINSSPNSDYSFNNKCASDLKSVLSSRRRRKSETDEDLRSWLVRYGSREAVLHMGPKPGVDLYLPTVNVSEHVSCQSICLNAYLERMGTKEMGSLTGQQNEVGFKGGGARFKNQKRQRKDSGDNESLTVKKNKTEQENCDKNDIFDIDETANDGMDMVTFSDPKNNNGETHGLQFDEKSNDDADFRDKDKDLFSDDDKYNNETDGESDAAILPVIEDVKKDQQSVSSPKLKTMKSKNKKDNSDMREKSPFVSKNILDSPEDQSGRLGASNFFKKSWNRELLMQQMKKGWSVYDAGDLTIGDLYLMFGSESKLELNYWWSEATPPLSSSTIQILKQAAERNPELPAEQSSTGLLDNVIKEKEKDKLLHVDCLLSSPTGQTSQESSETELLSPGIKHASSISDDPTTDTAFHLVSKMVNDPSSVISNVQHQTPPKRECHSAFVVADREVIVTVADRLQKLLSVAQMYSRLGQITCPCGHICGSSRCKRTLLSNSNEHGHLERSKPTDVPPALRVAPSKLGAATLTGPLDSKGQSTSIQPREIFRAPFSRGQLVPKATVDDPLRNSDPYNLSNLPKWNRRGRFRKVDRPVTEFHRILPKLACSPPRVSLPVHPNPAKVAPAPVLRVLPALRPKPVVRVFVRKESNDRSTPSTNMLTPSVPTTVNDGTPLTGRVNYNQYFSEGSLGNNNHSVVTNKQEELLNPSIYPHGHVPVHTAPGENETGWERVAEKNNSSTSQFILPDTTPSLANLMDMSMPSNIGEDSSTGKEKDGSLVKHETFAGLLQPDSMSIPSMSPSRLLNDQGWLESEVHNFSLSSFLGHLESTGVATGRSITNGVESTSSSRAADEQVDTQLQCLMSEASIDYMAKFEDLAAQVTAETSK